MHNHDCDDDFAALRRIICRLLCPPTPVALPRCRVTLRIGTISFTSIGDFMNTIPDDKVGNATIAYVDAKGNPAPVDGAPVWVSSDPTILTAVAAADGLSAVLTPVGPLGQVQLTITADADLGAGVVPVITLGDVQVVGGQAVTGNLTVTVA